MLAYCLHCTCNCFTWSVTMVAGTCMCCCYLTCTCIQNSATPVYKAAQTGQVRALKTLISAGAELNAADVVSVECIYFYTYCLYYTTFGIQIGGEVQKWTSNSRLVSLHGSSASVASLSRFLEGCMSSHLWYRWNYEVEISLLLSGSIDRLGMTLEELQCVYTHTKCKS